MLSVPLAKDAVFETSLCCKVLDLITVDGESFGTVVKLVLTQTDTPEIV
jgi:hypothetical protein